MTIVINGVELEVEFTYYPASRGARDSLGGVRGAGPPLEPDEDASIEIEKVEWKGLDITDLLNDWDKLDEVEAAIWADLDEGDE